MGGAGKREMRAGWALDSALGEKSHGEMIGWVGKRERSRRFGFEFDLHTGLL